MYIYYTYTPSITYQIWLTVYSIICYLWNIYIFLPLPFGYFNKIYDKIYLNCLSLYFKLKSSCWTIHFNIAIWPGQNDLKQTWIDINDRNPRIMIHQNTTVDSWKLWKSFKSLNRNWCIDLINDQIDEKCNPNPTVSNWEENGVL